LSCALKSRRRKLEGHFQQKILTAASNLVEVYKDDLDVSLTKEIVQFPDFVDTFKDEQAEDVYRELSFHVSADTQEVSSEIIS